MFFYVSFLRPPPVQVPPGPVLITPQVANDLRTELFSGAQDIFFSWCYAQPTGARYDAKALLGTTRPTKLTTWRQSGAYKEIPVPPPPGLRDGQLWRLVLTPQLQDAHAVLLSDQGFGRTAFPVMSMPILFSSRNLKGKTGSSKQEQIERIYEFHVQSKEEPVLLILREQTSFDLDKKVWDSGLGLSSWLVELFDSSPVPPGGVSAQLAEMKHTLFANKTANVIELGAGTGIVSLVLGALRFTSDTGPDSYGRIVTTDLPSAMSLLSQNITANAPLVSSPFNPCPEAIILDWDEEQLPTEILSAQGGFDVIIMADVTYNTSSFPALIRTLDSLVKFSACSKKRPMVLLGYKERDPAERVLWDMARAIGINFEQVGEKAGAGGAPVEVWIGKESHNVDGRVNYGHV